jgi:antitoxin CptB
MNSSSPSLDVERRRLLWRATHRGIKEMDLIVGGYAEAHLPTMSKADLKEFAEILEIPDQLLLSWATKQEDVPELQRSKLLQQVLAFRPRLGS